MFKESLEMSLQNIKSNKMRSFLTMLGIIIGVTAIIALITTVQGVTDEVTAQFEELGAGKITVRAPGTPLKSGLFDSDIQKLIQLENVSGISPTVSFSSDVVADQEVLEDVSIEGRNDIYFSSNTKLVKHGRGLTPLDMDTEDRVCVINKPLADDLFFGQEPLGQQVVVEGHTYTVVGMLDPDVADDVMSAMNRMNSQDADAKIIIPYKAALRMTGSSNITSLEVLVDDPAKTDAVVDSLEAVLSQAFNYKDDAYSIINLDSLLDTMNTMTSMMTTMLAGIASIALLVGGIGIMNMMLVSVTERTTEIGLRKALGAQPRRIQLQFLIESVVLSLLGGAGGILLGNLISLLAAVAIGFDFAFSPSATFLAFGFSAAVGVLFGWAPARKASRLNPIDALRSN
jgi:putative ABC transport system permease protein